MFCNIIKHSGFCEKNSTRHVRLEINTIPTDMKKLLFSGGIFLDLNKKTIDAVDQSILPNTSYKMAEVEALFIVLSTYRTAFLSTQIHISQRKQNIVGVPQF